MTRIAIYDTTLRDGMQGEGMSLSVEEKVRVARILDELDAEAVEDVRDPQLLLRGERHPLPLHPVAQGRVVDGDPGHGAGAGWGTTSSQSA